MERLESFGIVDCLLNRNSVATRRRKSTQVGHEAARTIETIRPCRYAHWLDAPAEASAFSQLLIVEANADTIHPADRVAVQHGKGLGQLVGHVVDLEIGLHHVRDLIVATDIHV